MEKDFLAILHFDEAKPTITDKPHHTATLHATRLTKNYTGSPARHRVTAPAPAC
jgi:hypothetical protein